MSSTKRPRARDVGISFGFMSPGNDNAITDVAGVKVGHCTLIEGEGVRQPGIGPIRTGVTAIFPHGGDLFEDKVAGVVYVINGFGKAMGIAQVQELGTIETPILLTNTLNVGLAADALISWMIERNPSILSLNPLVGECNDSSLNDIQGRHVHKEHVYEALNNAKSGPVTEGVVGGGTGMSALGFKGGIGTSSRILPANMGGFTIGVLVMANFGRRQDLTIAGVPVGKELINWPETEHNGDGSIMMVLATDAPLSTRQLTRVAKRCAFGLSRTGSVASHGSGDFVVAFSTANRQPNKSETIVRNVQRLAEDGRVLTGMFDATVEATEEAIINALFAAETMTGCDGYTRYGLPIEETLKIMHQYNRL